MKEFERRPNKLTSEPQQQYSKGGDIFMEGKPDMPPQNSQPASPERAEKPSLKQEVRPVSPERQEQVRRLWEKANEGRVLSVDEKGTIDKLVRRGLAPGVGGAQDIDKSGIQNPLILAEIDVINNLRNMGLSDLNVLAKGLEDVSRLSNVDDTEKQLAIGRIKDEINAEEALEKIRREKSRPADEQERRYSLYFTPKEQESLRRNPTEWLDQQFDILYKFAEEGQELSSPIINGIQQQVSQAVDFVKNYRPEVMSDFQNQFAWRLHLLQMRTAIGLRSIENVKQAAYELRFHGLLAGMTLEKGMVGAMFNRFQDLLESTRLSSNTRHHVMLQDVYSLQKVLIDEQLKLVKKTKTNFGDLSDIREEVPDPDRPETWDDFTWASRITDKDIEENNFKMTNDQIARIKRIRSVNARITRAVRTAYDVFASSQRMGVVVARGKYLFKDLAYRSDPIGPLNVYNMEALLFGKFDMFNDEQEEIVKRIKLDMANGHLNKNKKEGKPAQELSEEEMIDLGERLFRDIFAVPDFFSSGWRIKGVIQALEERFGKDRADSFALFMRLREAGDPKGKREIWEKIGEFRPEEIIRLFRERGNDRLSDLYKSMGVVDSDLLLNAWDRDANKSAEEGGPGRDITEYDKFKKKYGAVIDFLRQEGFNLEDSNGDPKSPTQIDLSTLNLNKDQVKRVDDFLGAGSGQQLVELAKQMQGFIEKENLIESLINDSKFADVYTRSIIIDDALLDKLEDEKATTDDADGYVPLSKIIGEAGAGGDTLTRSWNDTENAIKAGNSLIKFVKEEELEKKTTAALEFATTAGSYNGLGPRGQAECIRYTIGTFLNISKVDSAWDIIGVTSLGRISISEVQRILGPHAKAMSRDELRGHLDHLRGFMSSSLDKTREKYQIDLKIAEKAGLSENEVEKAKKQGMSNAEFKEQKLKCIEDKFKEDEEDAHKFYYDLEKLLEVDVNSSAKRFGLRLLVYLLLAAIGESYMVGKSSFKDTSK